MDDKPSYAVSDLHNRLETLETNIPINEKAGKVKEAAFEREGAESIRDAIAKLSGNMKEPWNVKK